MFFLLHFVFLTKILLLASCSESDDSNKIDLHRVDHEAFLGPDDAKLFHNLSTKESEAKLIAIINKIDKDKDEFITLKELEIWIKQVQKNYVHKDVEKQWKIHNPSEMKKLSWDEYRLATYSFLDNIENGIGDQDLKKYKNMEKKDKRRWKLADADNDGYLTKQEFSDFLHPERSEKINSVIVDETFEDIDKNEDEKISLKEYINDMYEDDPKYEPDWVEFERKQFSELRDKNKDGFLDKSEVKDWLLPPNIHSEAEHLIEISDKNKDGKLTKEEILDNHEYFVGSEVTNFGESLIDHDEF